MAGHFEFDQGADRYLDFDDDEGYRGRDAAIASSRLRLWVPARRFMHDVPVTRLRLVQSADGVVLNCESSPVRLTSVMNLLYRKG